MRKALIGALALVPWVAFAQSPSASSSLPVPDKAQLIGTTEAVEFHEFPELQKGQGASKQPMERMVGVTATDRVFQSDRSYNDTIKYFDKELKGASYTVMAKMVTPSATGWTLRTTDGKMSNVIVRNTQPKATIEAIEAGEAQGSMMKNPSTPQHESMPSTPNQNPMPRNY